MQGIRFLEMSPQELPWDLLTVPGKEFAVISPLCIVDDAEKPLNRVLFRE